MSYLDTAHRVYRDAAASVQKSLCCTTGPRFQLPGLTIPNAMEEMNYGCGTTVHVQDLSPSLDVLYIGVGSGLEALQFAYFTRRPRSVVAVDRVPEMLDVARRNFEEAERTNSWFRSDFVELLEGDALALPLPDARVDLVAQNCLFNIFTQEHLGVALAEVARVLKPGGRLVLSDPICEQAMPQRLRDDERLRAECLSGALPLDEYLGHVVRAGFGTIEIRSRRPYRVLDRRRFGVESDLLLESVEVVAIKGPMPSDGPCVFAGETVIYVGEDEAFDDGRGHLVQRDVPLAVCRKTAGNMRRLGHSDLIVTGPTWHYAGGGCC
ncbi:MAG: methyltransferase type 11 [Candidatus Eisenbacteria bacterium RBG_19FT_COMBO_70_11]|nr:MAG: methyltransferase type 11 [Candidatus Eisenbacteria bacterium RBG_19FT_COMBO_70_11]